MANVFHVPGLIDSRQATVVCARTAARRLWHKLREPDVSQFVQKHGRHRVAQKVDI